MKRIMETEKILFESLEKITSKWLRKFVSRELKAISNTLSPEKSGRKGGE